MNDEPSQPTVHLRAIPPIRFLQSNGNSATARGSTDYNLLKKEVDFFILQYSIFKLRFSQPEPHTPEKHLVPKGHRLSKSKPSTHGPVCAWAAPRPSRGPLHRGTSRARRSSHHIWFVAAEHRQPMWLQEELQRAGRWLLCLWITEQMLEARLGQHEKALPKRSERCWLRYERRRLGVPSAGGVFSRIPSASRRSDLRSPICPSLIISEAIGLPPYGLCAKARPATLSLKSGQYIDKAAAASIPPLLWPRSPQEEKEGIWVCWVPSDESECLVISSQVGDALVAVSSDPEAAESLPTCPLLLNKGSLSSLEANAAVSCPSEPLAASVLKVKEKEEHSTHAGSRIIPEKELDLPDYNSKITDSNIKGVQDQSHEILDIDIFGHDFPSFAISFATAPAALANFPPFPSVISVLYMVVPKVISVEVDSSFLSTKIPSQLYKLLPKHTTFWILIGGSHWRASSRNWTYEFANYELGYELKFWILELRGIKNSHYFLDS
ncbi:hypothetical protein Ccrd_008731 [Cynara cardunculus var. scolymus]|uniref:Uncharacterized protein ycf72 n=1 Tax=Cynara cardunculus var. scolymus TaxID=59895 RepID=A0A118JSU9_CYNCS|nr:hypothetical protein Ccrd_008731 [Cynara cardunculus var. scolymus]